METTGSGLVFASSAFLRASVTWANEAFMNLIGVEGTDQLLAHWDNVVAGKIDMNNLAGHSTCESRLDPHLVHSPQGGHVSFFQIHAPYDSEGGWDTRGPELQETILEKWQKAAPNMTKDNIIRTGYETPVGIEIRFPNMRKGGIKHGDYKPIQLGCFRPNQECSDNRTPIEGLYAIGEAAGFGGGGASGLKSLEGTFLSGCILTAQVAAEDIVG